MIRPLLNGIHIYFLFTMTCIHGWRASTKVLALKCLALRMTDSAFDLFIGKNSSSFQQLSNVEAHFLLFVVALQERLLVEGG